MSHKKSMAKFDRLYREERWKDLQTMIENQLLALPGGDPVRHWWLTRLSSVRYEQMDYAGALGFAREAREIRPNCPLVLWDMAGAFDMLGQPDAANEIYSRLILRGATTLAYGECGEGIEWSRSLVADCKKRLRSRKVMAINNGKA